MMRLVVSLCLGMAASVAAQPAITNIVLNPREVIVVPVAGDRLSLICFPTPISHLEGAYLSTEAEPPARFQINYKPGHAFFSVRALAPDTSAVVTVIWNRKPFVFELVSSPRPLLALTLVEPVAREVRTVERGPSARRLLGILDTAKAYALLRDQHPEEVAGVVCLPKSDRYDFGTYELRFEEVFHFKVEDTLVFRVVFRNKAGVAFQYQPQSFRIEVGTRIYYATIADGDGTVPPLASAPVYFAVASAPDGSRPGLSLQNDFRILFSLGPAAPPPPSNSAGTSLHQAR